MYIFDLSEHVYWLLQLERRGTRFCKSPDIMSWSFRELCISPSRGLLMLQVVFRLLCSFCCFSFIGVSANRLMGGAMQLTFRKMAFDYYPFHWAGRRFLNGGSSSMAGIENRFLGSPLTAQQEGVRDCSTWGIEISLFKRTSSGNFQGPLIDDSLSVMRGRREGRQCLRCCFSFYPLALISTRFRASPVVYGQRWQQSAAGLQESQGKITYGIQKNLSALTG